MNHSEIIEKAVSGTIVLTSIDIETLKKLNGKTFKQVIKSHVELLHGMKDGITYYDPKEKKRVHSTKPLFSKEELLEVGKVSKEPKLFYKDQILDPNTKEALQLCLDHGGLSGSVSLVVELPAIGGYNKFGDLEESKSKVHRTPLNTIASTWHAIKAQKLDETYAGYKAGRDAAEKTGDKEMVTLYTKVMEQYKANYYKAVENGKKSLKK